MKQSFKALLVGLVFSALLSCSEEVKVTPYTYTATFTGEHSRTWKIKFWEQTLNGAVVETFSVGCMSDDQFTFFAGGDHAYQVATGSNKCYDDPVEDAVITDTWDFNNASATMLMIMPIFDTTSRLPFVVREAKKNDMVLEIFFDQEGTESYRIHMNLTDED